MTTAYVTPPAFLARSGVEVTIGDIPRDDCPWCDEEGAVTTVRVHGDPDESLHSPIHTTDCCGLCANELVDRALSEQSDYSRAPIRVEIAR